MNRYFIRVACGTVLIALGGCTSPTELYDGLELPVEHYTYSTRQEPTPRVYGRMMWSQPPRPLKVSNAPSNAPLLMPRIEIDMVDATLGEALESISQTMGYRLIYPRDVAGRKISVRQVGTLEEILEEIASQGGVGVLLDHEERVIRVGQERTVPSLPGELR